MRWLGFLLPLLSTAGLGACGGSGPGPATALASLPPPAPGDLRPPDVFDAIPRRADRSAALFLEMSRVLLHPRCVNCHPDGDVPHQGMAGALHEPPVLRGPDDHGIPGLECTSCHQDHNVDLARVPGAPAWHLAPIEMAWVGKTPHAICEQMKDPDRNGGKTLDQLVEHNAHDALVGWGWAPGDGREPAPGTQARFGEITAAWVATGAACPPEEAKP
jgi:hypothetical protein